MNRSEHTVPRNLPAMLTLALAGLLAGFLTGFTILIGIEGPLGEASLLVPAAILFPIAWAATVEARWTSSLTCGAMLPGVFVGACTAVLVFHPGEANLFPISAAFWTCFALPGVLFGWLAGLVHAACRERARSGGSSEHPS